MLEITLEVQNGAMNKTEDKTWIDLDTSETIWNRFYTVAPLVVIGTKEGLGYDLAPKHMVTPLGHQNYFGFVCTPEHGTYHNAKVNEEFTVSFIRPNQVVLASLAASNRCGEDRKEKQIIQNLPTQKGKDVDALIVKDSYLVLECTLDRIIDDFGAFSLIAGKIISAYVQKDALRVSDIEDADTIYNSPLLAYLAYGRFAEIKNSKAFPFPKDFVQKNLINEKLK